MTSRLCTHEICNGTYHLPTAQPSRRKVSSSRQLERARKKPIGIIREISIPKLASFLKARSHPALLTSKFIPFYVFLTHTSDQAPFTVSATCDVGVELIH